MGSPVRSVRFRFCRHSGVLSPTRDRVPTVALSRPAFDLHVPVPPVDVVKDCIDSYFLPSSPSGLSFSSSVVENVHPFTSNREETRTQNLLKDTLTTSGSHFCCKNGTDSPGNHWTRKTRATGVEDEDRSHV